MNVNFSYTIGTARFNLAVDVEEDEWNEMDKSERLDLLKEEALEEVSEMIEVEEDSIED